MNYLAKILGPISLSVLALGALACGPVTGVIESDPPDVTPGFPPPPDDPFNPGNAPPCDATFKVTSTNALVVTDPAVLANFTLERVLDQIILTSGSQNLGALEMLQRLFDTENDAANAVFTKNAHCDDVDNRAFKNDTATDCPRAEGALAKSAGLLTPGSPDYFMPIAIVNRFDLTPQSLMTCGEQRIVFAKSSGLTDPNNRLFLIFEGSLPNVSGSPWGCYSAAKNWASLTDETDPAEITAKLEEIFFVGTKTIDGFPVPPVVHADNYGVIGSEDDAYGASHGQIRVSQRMQDPWEMREYRLLRSEQVPDRPAMVFEPATVKNNPIAELFDTTLQSEKAIGFRNDFMGKDTISLAAPDLAHLRMQTSNEHNAGESAVSGDAQTNYMTYATGIAGQDFKSQIDQLLESAQLGSDCPAEDPLNGDAIVRRAEALTCAGCHAPEKFLGPDRKIGCGLVWPNTLGEVHIDEKGALSPALQDVFLPRRAEVLTMYVQACDLQEIFDNLTPGMTGGIPK